jgi:hypothetical protein
MGPNKDEKEKGFGQGKYNGKRLPDGNQDKQDLVHDNNKSHQHWKLKDNENFTKVFYKHQKECPKTHDGKLICMKFSLPRICTKSCTRAHILSPEDSKSFEVLIHECRAALLNQIFIKGQRLFSF